jgi:hypothetical protein
LWWDTEYYSFLHRGVLFRIWGRKKRNSPRTRALWAVPPTMDAFSKVSPPLAFGEGDLSFPTKEVYEIYEGYDREYKEGTWALTTRQTMRRIAYCASQGDPFATLYLGHAFMRTSTVAEGECLYAKLLYRIAYPKIVVIAENPSDSYYEQANFQLALEAFKNWDKIRYLSSNLTPLEYIERIPTSRRGELLKLLYKLRYGPKDEKPLLEEFLHEEDLKNHPWAFLTSMYFYNECKGDERIKIYETAISKHSHPAFLIDLGNIHLYGFHSPWTEFSVKQRCKEKALPFYKKAGKLSCPIAYMKMTELIVPYKIMEHDFDFEKITSKEDFLQCCTYMSKAADLGLPEAFYI